MKSFFAVVALIVVGLTALYLIEMRASVGRLSEFFVGSESGAAADVAASLPLQDVLDVRPGLSDLGAASCAAGDVSRQLELGGQYVQRTNNYRRTYPDSCSAPLTEFVGAVYRPVAVGADVPCAGQC